jgi:hypothetical protein
MDRPCSCPQIAGATKLEEHAKRIPEVGFDRIMAQFKLNKQVKDINGWGFTTKTGIMAPIISCGRS